MRGLADGLESLAAGCSALETATSHDPPDPIGPCLAQVREEAGRAPDRLRAWLEATSGS